MQVYLNIAQIIISVTVIILVLLQTKGGGLGSVFGSDSSIYRTRRGMERTVFLLTIAFAILFLVISTLSVFMT